MPRHRKSKSNRSNPSRNSRRRRNPASRSKAMEIIQCHKDFQIVPPPTGTRSPDWLKVLVNYAVIAAKLIVLLAAVDSLPTQTAYPLSMAQVIYLSAEDLLLRHRLCYKDSGTTRAIVPFDQAKVLSVTVIVTSAVKLSSRVGRGMLSILPVTEDESDQIQTNQKVDLPVTLIGPLNTDQRMKCVTGDMTKPLIFNWKPSGYNASFFSIGTTAPGKAAAAPTGGRQTFKVIFAYQNFATDGNLGSTYSTDNAVFNMTVKARVAYRGIQPVALREIPLTVSPEQAKALSDGEIFDIPLTAFNEDGTLKVSLDHQSISVISSPLRDLELE